MILKENLIYVDTQRDTHFTSELVTGASEYENLVVTSDGHRLTGHITELRMIAATRHDFTVAFYSRDVFNQRLAATPFAGALVGMVHLDAIGAWRQGTEYIYATDFPSIQYIDEDNSGELHLGLHNRDSKTKNALGGVITADSPAQYIHIRIGMIAAT